MRRIQFLFISLLVSVIASAEAKYIFYFIGDGMGANQVLLTEMFLAEQEGRIGRHALRMTQLPYSGQLATFSDSNGITDSSAAGTCLASGVKTTNGFLGVTSDKKPVASIAEKLHTTGYGVGITTSVSIDHATPAAFYAHVSDRGSYYAIGSQLAKSGFEFFGGASFIKPEKKDEWNKPNLYDLCEENGYTFAHGYQQALATQADKVILIQENEGLDRSKKGTYKLPYAIDKKESDLTLPEITDAAIRHLESKHDRFFLMVEGGAIDWACHGNDAATVVREVMEFDAAIEVAYQFYLNHPDETLIVITADHETGGCALGNSDYTLNLKALAHQHCSNDLLTDGLKALQKEYGKRLKWEQVRQYLTEKLGLYDAIEVSEQEDANLQKHYKQLMKQKSESVKTLYKEIDGLSNAARGLLNRKAKVGWTTHSHSASAVPVFSVGVGAEQFTGWHDNSEVSEMIWKASR